MVRPDKADFTDHAKMSCCCCSTAPSERRERIARRAAQGLARYQETCLGLDFCLKQDFF